MDEKRVQTVVLTRKENIIHFLKFTGFSISAGVIQITSFTLIYELTNQFNWWVAYLPSLVLSVIWNFTLNRKFTFKSAANIPIAMMKVFGYYLVFTPLSLWGGDVLVDQYGWNGYLVEFLVMLMNFVTEFLFTKFVVYRNQIYTALEVEKKPSNLGFLFY